MSGRWPQLAQLALCSSDIAATVRLYTEAFGFADAGARVHWGRHLARVHRLGEDATCMTWWMVGRQDLVQLEIFHHVQPPQRPAPADRRASDLGWVRWGVALPDFDFALTRLARFGVEPVTEPIVHSGLRRVCIRDPGTGVFVELLEEGPATPGGVRTRDATLVPAVVYATLSVPDLATAREFYVDVVGLDEDRSTVLHTVGMEALWGLEGASRETVLLRAGDCFLELVQYSDPVGRPASGRLSDQGFMNGGVMVRERRDFDAILARAAARGLDPHVEPADRPNTEAYLPDGTGSLVEVMLVPREYEAEYGFVARPRFPPSQPWPSPRVGPAAR